MEVRHKDEANCPFCSSLLNKSDFNLNTTFPKTEISSCNKNCKVQYSHLMICQEDHPDKGFIFDREFYVFGNKITVNYYFGSTTIIARNNEPNSKFYKFPLIEFKYDDLPSIENKIKTLIVFA